MQIDNKKYIIICGNGNVNCVIGNESKSQHDAVLHSYNVGKSLR